jgi:hypothetical protein
MLELLFVLLLGLLVFMKLGVIVIILFGNLIGIVTILTGNLIDHKMEAANIGRSRFGVGFV